MYIAGSPISKPENDVLGREKFVAHLNQLLLSYREEASLCVAIYGRWGSGKSSVLNLTERLLKNGDTLPAPVVLRFNPWNYSDQAQLTKQFFVALSLVLDSPTISSEYATARKDIDRLSQAVNPSSSWAWPWQSHTRPTYSAGAKQTLESLRASISQQLASRKRRIVIIIDDIDRLNIVEIRQIFQLIKSVADFSNVIYVLALDREIIEHALIDMQGPEGVSYLEKIVNIPLELPPVRASKLRDLLYDRACVAFAPYSGSFEWSDQTRMVSMILAISSSLHTLRAVDRIINLLVFIAPMVEREVDAIDILAITSLQVLVPKCYYFIRNNPAIFVETSENRLLRTDDSERIRREQ